MADQSTQSIVIKADAEDIMDVIADFEAYPEWADAVKSAHIVESNDEGYGTEVAFSLDAGVLKDEYTLAYDWSQYPGAVSWRLVTGKMQKAQNGTYSLSTAADGTKVTYTLSVDLSIPMIGLMKRKGEKMIMDTALKELKRRVEAS